MARFRRSRRLSVLFASLLALLTALLSGPVRQTFAGPLPQQDQGRIIISCRFYSENDREFIVTLEERTGGPPSGTATLERVDGGQDNRSFTGTSLSFRGPYVSLSISATWPDGATGFASATCGQVRPSPTATATPGPTRTPRPTNTPGPTRTPGPTPTPRPTRTPGPTPTPRPTRTPTLEPATPTQQPPDSGGITITCEYFGPRDRLFQAQLVERPVGPPTGIAELTLVDGGVERQSFSSNTLSYRGPYLRLAISATWPDGATGFASATCGQIVPTPLPTATSVPSPTAELATAVPPTTPPTQPPQPTPVTPPPPAPTATATLPPTQPPLPEPTPTSEAPPPATATPPASPSAPGAPPAETSPPAPPPAGGGSDVPSASPPPRQAIAGASDETEPPAQAGTEARRAVLPASGALPAAAHWWLMGLAGAWIMLGVAGRIWLRRSAAHSDN
ncbi:hypothetical protein [Kallotenue papyrolyticum]|uniref:hypothetical protein n=1 Tax=Kallotenue papyrolyticum TaxID=1325125 RepID=UPI000471C22D|nr:hypothetical protein [Kallotenue papyrolyticum]